MFSSIAAWLLVSAASFAVAAPPNSNDNNAARNVAKRFDRHAIHEARSVLPSGWTRNDAIASHLSERAGKDATMLPLRINLVQGGLEKGHDILMDISDPNSPRYGEHLTADEVAELFAPSDDAVDSVLAWLTDFGLDVSRESNYHKGKGAISVKVSMSDAEDLLKTTYNVYEHTSGTPHVACESYSIPSSLKDHIDFVTPTTHFDVHVKHPKRSPTPAPTPDGLLDLDLDERDIDISGHPGVMKHKHKSPVSPKPGDQISNPAQAGSTSGCDSQITPACLRALYGINYTPKKNIQNAYGIVEYTPQSYLPTDMDTWFKQYAPSLVGQRPVNKSIDGGTLTTSASSQSFDNNGESDLDLQYAMALVAPTKVNLYQTGDPLVLGSFNTFLDALDGSYCAGDDPSRDPKYPDNQPGGFKGAHNCGGYATTFPQVVSTSYGYNEIDLTPVYEGRQCQEYMKLGLMGITFIFSSGDYGVAGNGGQCIDPSSNTVVSDGGTKFNPAFPSTCPYVTSIGATEVYPGNTVTIPEGAANNIIFSGGGFSNNFAMPAYQSTAIGHYFSAHKPNYPASRYNSSGKMRGYPDMAVNGVNYVVVVDGTFQLIYGTSAAAPVAGAIFVLINDARAAAGKKPIGFVNPTLYANPSMFHDIEYGSNPGCGTTGFAAVKSWDPVTGLGTPQFQKFMTVFMGLK